MKIRLEGHDTGGLEISFDVQHVPHSQSVSPISVAMHGEQGVIDAFFGRKPSQRYKDIRLENGFLYWTQVVETAYVEVADLDELMEVVRAHNDAVELEDINGEMTILFKHQYDED